jgi:hypothetical protein
MMGEALNRWFAAAVLLLAFSGGGRALHIWTSPAHQPGAATVASGCAAGCCARHGSASNRDADAPRDERDRDRPAHPHDCATCELLAGLNVTVTSGCKPPLLVDVAGLAVAFEHGDPPALERLRTDRSRAPPIRA